MRKIIFILFVYIFLCNSSMLQAQYLVDWASGFGGDRMDNAKCVIEASDGNLMIAGKVAKEGTHLWILKLDTDGKEIWGKTYEDNFASTANSLIEVKDTCFIVAGYISKDEKVQDVNGWILKTDFHGNVLWEKEYGKMGYEEISDIISTKDGGLLAVGFSMANELVEKEIWIMKLDSQGGVEWTRLIKSTSEDVANAVIQTSDAGFVIVGSGYMFRRKLMRVFKIDSEGNDLWDLPFKEDVIEEANDVIEMPDNTLYVVGKHRHKSISDFDAMIYKLSAAGDSVWQRTYGYERWEEATAVTKTFDDKIAVSGFSNGSKMMDSNFWLKIIDQDGNITWEEDFKRKSLDYAEAITECRDNGLAIVGSTYYTDHGWDYAVLKFKSSEKTRMRFIFPSDSIANVTTKNIELDLCVTSHEELKNVDIFVNGKIQRTGPLEADFLSSDDCKYPLFASIELLEGKNTIKVIITDVKKFQVIKEISIFYIPTPDVNW